MHIILASGGTFQVEVFCLYRAVARVIPDAWDRRRNEFQRWAPGRGGGKAPLHLFSPARKKACVEAGHF
eukprot:7585275-Pyramimonas_sp.AAC.1